MLGLALTRNTSAPISIERQSKDGPANGMLSFLPLTKVMPTPRTLCLVVVLVLDVSVASEYSCNYVYWELRVGKRYRLGYVVRLESCRYEEGLDLIM